MLLYILSLLGGLLLPLSFLPFGLYTIAYISPALLLYSWLKSSPRTAFIHGMLYGIGVFGIGVSWIYNSIHNFGNASVFLSVVITSLFVIILALFFGLQGYLSRLIFKSKSNVIQAICVFPAMWLLFEWLRTHIFTGLPWLLIGYTQSESMLSSLAPIIGTYGLSLCVVLISGCLVTTSLKSSKKNKIISIIIILLILLSAKMVHGKTWITQGDNQIKTSLVQGSFQQALKWDANELTNILDTYKDLSKKHLDSDIIVWPEAAIPYYPSQLPSYINEINALGANSKTTLIVGAPTFNKDSKQFYNSLLVLGDASGKYDKTHLVPFGEYTPFNFVFNKLMKTLSIPMSNFTPGNQTQEPLVFKYGTIAPFICYEIIFPNEVLKKVKNTNLIVVINDDAWFGDSLALAQHLQMAKMAAEETQRYVLFCSNTGISAIISPNGTIVKEAPLNTQTVISGNIKTSTGQTPLMRFGYWPTLIVTLLLLCI